MNKVVEKWDEILQIVKTEPLRRFLQYLAETPHCLPG